MVKYNVSCWRPGCKEGFTIETEKDPHDLLQFCTCGAGLIYENDVDNKPDIDLYDPVLSEDLYEY